MAVTGMAAVPGRTALARSPRDPAGRHGISWRRVTNEATRSRRCAPAADDEADLADHRRICRNRHAAFPSHLRRADSGGSRRRCLVPQAHISRTVDTVRRSARCRPRMERRRGHVVVAVVGRVDHRALPRSHRPRLPKATAADDCRRRSSGVPPRGSEENVRFLGVPRTCPSPASSLLPSLVDLCLVGARHHPGRAAREGEDDAAKEGTQATGTTKTPRSA